MEVELQETANIVFTRDGHDQLIAQLQSMGGVMEEEKAIVEDEEEQEEQDGLEAIDMGQDQQGEELLSEFAFN